MKKNNTCSDFVTQIQKPAIEDSKQTWAFIVLPHEVSTTLTRRGRITVLAKINDYAFNVLLEPDGNKSHWLRIEQNQLMLAKADVGIDVNVNITPLDNEPDPIVPADLANALAASPPSNKTWQATTTTARLDWIHWITSAKQVKTRIKRINDACDMLASGKKRVCCFDTSGFYSKAFTAPKPC